MTQRQHAHHQQQDFPVMTLEQVNALTQISTSEDPIEIAAAYRSGIATLRSSSHRVKANPKFRKQNPNPKTKAGIETHTTCLPDALYREDVFDYDLASYNLRAAIASLLHHKCDPTVVGTFRHHCSNDNDSNHNDDNDDNHGDNNPTEEELVLEDFVLPSNTLHRKVNGGCCEDAQAYLSDAVASDANFLKTFDKFVTDVVLPYFKQRLIQAGAAQQDQPLSFYVQRPPTVRLQPGPGRAGVKPHHDGEYGHQNGELNFWLPLTDRNLTGVDLWCETTAKGGDFHPIVAHIGQVISFHGSSLRHFVNRNDSDKTRVSMDFRVGVEGFFDPYWQMNGTTDDHGRMEIRL